MLVDVFDKENNKAGKIDLPERIFGVKWNPDLVHQALLTQMANGRFPWAHAKGRGEVRGGGKKPWRQKGTGRARHGSIRSPIWKGGGVTFGPLKEKIFAKKINKKMRQLAIFSLLSKKLKDGELKVIDEFKVETKKTKEWAKVLKSVLNQKPSALLVPGTAKKEVHQAVTNLKNVKAISPHSLNVYDLAKYKNIILEKEAVAEMEKHYTK